MKDDDREKFLERLMDFWMIVALLGFALFVFSVALNGK